MWAHARIELGLSDAEFWAMTPRQFQSLDKAWMARERREYGRTGIIAAMVGNFSMRAPKEPFKHTDFVPGYVEPPMDDDELAEQIMATFAGMTPNSPSN